MYPFLTVANKANSTSKLKRRNENLVIYSKILNQYSFRNRLWGEKMEAKVRYIVLENGRKIDLQISNSVELEQVITDIKNELAKRKKK